MNKKNNIFIATTNKGKIKDFTNLLPNHQFQTLLDIDIPEIEETGLTFQENALLKAKTISKLLNITVIADDSGLVCKSLNGAPGIYSSRYAGTGKDEDNNNLLLENIKGKDKEAAFVACICLYFPSGEYHFFEGQVVGKIIDTPNGTNGFGYDPIFYIESLEKTFAQLSINEKNKISHRKMAIQKLIDCDLL